MKLRKILAGALALTMMFACGIPAFADDAASGATGSSTLVPHLDKEVTDVTLPTTAAVATVFNFTVDPEGLIKDATKLADGTSVTGNDDGVYFALDSGAYASSSKEVEFVGKNSVDVDVTVTASITPDNAETDIPLVADDDGLTAASGGALLLQLKVGSDTKAITTEGDTVCKAQIDGIPDNFEVKAEGGSFTYAIKASPSTWNKTSVQLIGKTNGKDLEAGATCPSVSLTWTVAKHSDAPTTPDFASAVAGQITYNTATVTSITTIEVPHPNGTFDVYHALAGFWNDAEAVDDEGVTTVTIDPAAVSFWTGDSADPTATITYVDADGETQTESITWKTV